MANKKRILKKDIARALKEHQGNVAATARGLRCSAQNLRRRIKDDPDLLAVQKEMREQFVDVAQAQLYRNVVEANDGLGDMRAILTVLERWGASRGWGKKEEMTLRLPAHVHAYLRENNLTREELLDAFVAELGRRAKR